MRFSKAILLTAAAALLPLVSQATTVSSNPTLTVGGLTFGGFSCSFTSDGSGSPDSCRDINVQTINQPGTGIKFVSGFSAFGNNAFRDAQIDYNVSSTSGISKVGLFFNGYFYGQAIAAVTETIYNNGTQVGFANVSCGVGEAGCKQSDEITLDGTYSNLFVQKDILLASYSDLSGSYASYIDQTFNDATPTPEPSSIALLSGGLLAGAGLLRRRKLAVKA